MAHVIQKPYEKIKVALALKSTYEGAGKGCIVDKLMQIIGDKHSCQVANDTDLFGDFTSTMSGKVLMDLDEAVWGGNKKAKGLLKNMITEKMVRIRMMRTDSYQEPSYHAFIFTSNEDWFLPANSNSRRYFALELDNRYAGPETPESKAYFDPIWAVKAEHLAHFLYHRDISKFDPRQVPITELLKEQATFSMSPVEKWFRNCMEEGEFLSTYEHVDEQGYEEIEKYIHWNAWHTKDKLYHLYTKATKGVYGNLRESGDFFKKLYKLLDSLGLKYEMKKQAEFSYRRCFKFTDTLEDTVAVWNAKRGDNVETQHISVEY